MLTEIARLRRDLVHEALWDREVLGAGGATSASVLASDHLRRFNRRLISAFLGYQNSYVGQNWTSIGSPILDAVPQPQAAFP